MSNITFDIYDIIGAVSKDEKGWNRELTVTGWNGGKPKYDLRSWDASHYKMGRGMTFTEAEMKNLAEGYKTWREKNSLESVGSSVVYHKSSTAEGDAEYTIHSRISTLCVQSPSWRKELTVTSWNGKAPLFDIRDWKSGLDGCGKGIRLNAEEMETLFSLYEGYGKNLEQFLSVAEGRQNSEENAPAGDTASLAKALFSEDALAPVLASKRRKHQDDSNAMAEALKELVLDDLNSALKTDSPSARRWGKILREAFEAVDYKEMADEMIKSRN